MPESVLPDNVDVNAPELIFIGMAEELGQDKDEINMKELIDEANKRNDGTTSSGNSNPSN